MNINKILSKLNKQVAKCSNLLLRNSYIVDLLYRFNNIVYLQKLINRLWHNKYNIFTVIHIGNKSSKSFYIFKQNNNKKFLLNILKRENRKKLKSVISKKNIKNINIRKLKLLVRIKDKLRYCNIYICKKKKKNKLYNYIKKIRYYSKIVYLPVTTIKYIILTRKNVPIIKYYKYKKDEKKRLKIISLFIFNIVLIISKIFFLYNSSKILIKSFIHIYY